MDSVLIVHRVGSYPGIRVDSHSRHGRWRSRRPQQSLSSELLVGLEVILQGLGLLLGSRRTVGAVAGIFLASFGGIEEATDRLGGGRRPSLTIFDILSR